jgi:hypothetical protein
MKQKDFEKAYKSYWDVNVMLEKTYESEQIETEKENLKEDLHIVKYNIGNALMVKFIIRL